MGSEYYKSVFTSIFFYVLLATAMVSLGIVVLWGAGNYKNGMKNRAQEVLFGLAAPSTTVVLWAVIFSLLALKARPSEVMMIGYFIIGIVMHLIVFIVQMMVVMDAKNNDVMLLMILSIVCVIGNVAGLVMELVSEEKTMKEVSE